MEKTQNLKQKNLRPQYTWHTGNLWLLLRYGRPCHEPCRVKERKGSTCCWTADGLWWHVATHTHTPGLMLPTLIPPTEIEFHMDGGDNKTVWSKESYIWFLRHIQVSFLAIMFTSNETLIRHFKYMYLHIENKTINLCFHTIQLLEHDLVSPIG